MDILHSRLPLLYILAARVFFPLRIKTDKAESSGCSAENDEVLASFKIRFS